MRYIKHFSKKIYSGVKKWYEARGKTPEAARSALDVMIKRTKARKAEKLGKAGWTLHKHRGKIAAGAAGLALGGAVAALARRRKKKKEAQTK